MHDHLLSLRRLRLQGQRLGFRRAYLVWRRTEAGVSWSGTVRGVSGEVPTGEAEVKLAAETLDGRSVAGRAVVRTDPHTGVARLEGCGPLLVAGRAP